MAKSIKVTPKKLRGRPATGKDPHVTARMPAHLIGQVEDWAKRNNTGRSEAIRRLVEIGLDAARPPARPSLKAAKRAAELATKVIDHHVAGAPDADVRKRRILKGPSIFRDLRKA